MADIGTNQPTKNASDSLKGTYSVTKVTMRRPRVRFSRSVEEYSDLLTKYFEDPKVDHENEKIAHVLHRSLSLKLAE